MSSVTSENKARVGRLDMEIDASRDEDAKSQYLKVTEVAKRLAVSPMTVYRQVNQGKLPAIRVGNSVRVHLKDLESYVRNQTMTYGTKESK